MTELHAVPDPPRRLRAADVIQAQQHVIDQLTTRTSEPYVSVEFNRNAKGETQISTKVSAPGGITQESLNDLAALVFEQARDTYRDCQDAHPFGGAA